MAKVYVTSFHKGNKMEDYEGNTVADIVRLMDISMNGVDIFINGEEASLSDELEDKDTVSFQKNDVKNG